MFSQVLSQSVVFSHASPHDVSEYVNSHVGNHRIDVRGRGDILSSLRYTEFAGLGLSHITYGGDVRVTSPELHGIYHLQVVTAGHGTWRYGSEEFVLGPGEAIMMNPLEKVDLVYSNDCHKLIVKFPQELLHAACASTRGVMPKQGVRFEKRVQDIAATRSFLRLLEALYDEADESGVDVSTISEHYRNLVTSKILSLFPNNLTMEPGDHSLEPSFKEVDQHIQANIKQDITVEELAQLCNVSLRTLYNLFARQVGTTPKNYIKQLKLQHVHHELQRQDRVVRNVTEVALDYGFSHLGRFSSDYKKMFGKLPSETLRRN